MHFDNSTYEVQKHVNIGFLMETGQSSEVFDDRSANKLWTGARISARFLSQFPSGWWEQSNKKRYQKKVVEIRKWEVSIDKGKFLEKRRAKLHSCSLIRSGKVPK